MQMAFRSVSEVYRQFAACFSMLVILSLTLQTGPTTTYMSRDCGALPGHWERGTRAQQASTRRVRKHAKHFMG